MLSVRISTGPMRNSDQLQPVKKGDSDQPWTRCTIFDVLSWKVISTPVEKSGKLCSFALLFILTQLQEIKDTACSLLKKLSPEVLPLPPAPPCLLPPALLARPPPRRLHPPLRLPLLRPPHPSSWSPSCSGTLGLRKHGGRSSSKPGFQATKVTLLAITPLIWSMLPGNHDVKFEYATFSMPFW